MTNHYSQKDNLISIMKEISKKTPRGILNGDTQVGHITWQMYLMRDYLKLDGTPLANASSDYSDLLSFAQDNNLITADTTDNSLFKYNSTTDVLTLPNYIDLVLQGGNTIEEKEAGLPNIKGQVRSRLAGSVTDDAGSSVLKNGSGAFGMIGLLNDTAGNVQYQANVAGKVSYTQLDASTYNSIYSDSINTVQPPAITLIPQIKYRKATTMYEQIEAVVNYSTTEKVIGTWIDGKPLYQKTYSGTVPTGADSASADVFVDADVIGNADTIFISGGYIKWLGGGNPNDATVVLLNESNNDTTSIRTWSALGRNAIRIRCISAYISCPIVVTLQYTKTTD